MKGYNKNELLEQLDGFDVKRYATSRNFVDGGVSKLSPYITHGVITVRECVAHILTKHTIKSAEKFVMELVWKEFFMQVQKSYGNQYVSHPVRDDKTHVTKKQILPHRLVEGLTQTTWVNDAIQELYDTGRLHNHKRMWLASWCCHRAKIDRKKCADWTYYHFVDGELSSNHLSRQWVNSTFANKAYMMNEENIQKYRLGNSDPDLRGSYDQVSARLFDESRTSMYWQDNDRHDILQTPLDEIDSYHHDMIDANPVVRVLSPRRLDTSLLSDDVPTMVVLDEDFTHDHPRSSKRLAFVRQYTQQYDIPFIYGSVEQIVDDILMQGKQCILDERRDPYYADILHKMRNHELVEILLYDWINPTTYPEPIMKFFKYWNKTLPFIKKLQDG